jgi:hypothetical protein
MKVYVRGYGPLREDETPPQRYPFEPKENYGVEYRPTPDDWTMSTRDEAEMHCRDLTRLQAHVGPHYCEFSVQELPEGAFAIASLALAWIGLNNDFSANMNISRNTAVFIFSWIGLWTSAAGFGVSAHVGA